MKPIPLLVQFLAVSAICGLGCKTAKVTSEREFTSHPVAKPAVVYVSDFELGAWDIHQDPGILYGRPGPIGRAGDRLSGTSTDPAARARQIVELMANSLVKELSNSGFTAIRLMPSAPLPAQGWFVRGIFTEVEEGNRLRRAMIGFGQGQTDIQVITTIDDLSQGAPKPLYEIATDAASGTKSGAAPTLIIGPYGAAARFVMAGKDLDKNVKHTAGQIAEQLAKHIDQAK